MLDALYSSGSLSSGQIRELTSLSGRTVRHALLGLRKMHLVVERLSFADMRARRYALSAEASLCSR